MKPPASKKLASHSLTGGAGQDEEFDDDDVAEIGTHRKESQNELSTVNRFNSNTKNQSINQSQENMMLEQRMSPVNHLNEGRMNSAMEKQKASQLHNKSDTGL